MRPPGRGGVMLDVISLAGDAATDKALQQWLGKAFRDIKAHTDAWPFQEPVDRSVRCSEQLYSSESKSKSQSKSPYVRVFGDSIRRI